jgi:hypothetical protein
MFDQHDVLLCPQGICHDILCLYSLILNELENKQLQDQQRPHEGDNDDLSAHKLGHIIMSLPVPLPEAFLKFFKL